MFDQLIQQTNQRLLILLMIGISVILFALAYNYWFKQPYKDYQQQLLLVTSLQIKPSLKERLKSDIVELSEEIDKLDLKLSDTGREVLKGTRSIKVITELGQFAKQYKVQLLGITPSPAVVSERYIKTPFTINLAGQYVQLYQWLYSLENSKNPLLIEQLSVQPNAKNDSRLMSLTVNLIQPIQEEKL